MMDKLASAAERQAAPGPPSCSPTAMQVPMRAAVPSLTKQLVLYPPPLWGQPGCCSCSCSVAVYAMDRTLLLNTDWWQRHNPVGGQRAQGRNQHQGKAMTTDTFLEIARRPGEIKPKWNFIHWKVYSKHAIVISLSRVKYCTISLLLWFWLYVPALAYQQVKYWLFVIICICMYLSQLITDSYK
jgi:hypothetical protein